MKTCESIQQSQTTEVEVKKLQHIIINKNNLSKNIWFGNVFVKDTINDINNKIKCLSVYQCFWGSLVKSLDFLPNPDLPGADWCPLCPTVLLRLLLDGKGL